MTLKLQSPAVLSCSRHMYLHLFAEGLPPTSLSVPTKEALNNSKFPLQEALWWERSRECQSLKDDSLSELLAGPSWSCALPVPPSGTGASGELLVEVRDIFEMLIVQCQTPKYHHSIRMFTNSQWDKKKKNHTLREKQNNYTHSSKLGSKPSMTILFLIAITGTPWNKEYTH